jgi:hypothetical protein
VLNDPVAGGAGPRSHLRLPYEWQPAAVKGLCRRIAGARSVSSGLRTSPVMQHGNLSSKQALTER